MCGRFILVDVIGLGLRFRVQMTDDMSLVPRFNIAPTQQVWTITNEDGLRRAEQMRWGLIPSWAKSANQIRSSFNARSDRLAGSGLWQRSFTGRRCIIPANGFYEWTGPKNNRQPHLIRLTEGRLLGFAGLFDAWQNLDTGEMVRSCAIITTGPNALMKTIHDRMPAILDVESEALWLDPSTEDTERLSALLQPYPAEEMERHAVSKNVNSVHHDRSEMIEALDMSKCGATSWQSGF
ncbi:MAG: SOS response-associated peptidase [Dehalococcoidia bacterium]